MKWEDLCNHCGDCCQMWGTKYVCPLYDLQNNRCRDYKNRFSKISDCVQVAPDNIDRLLAGGVLSNRCNYVRNLQGKDLLWDVEPKPRKAFASAPIQFKAHYYQVCGKE